MVVFHCRLSANRRDTDFFGEDIGLNIFWLLQKCMHSYACLFREDQDGFCFCGKSFHVIQINLENVYEKIEVS